MTQKDVLAAIRSKAREVAPDATVILFGSRARGDARPDSDWDLLILLDKDDISRSDHDDIAYPLVELGWDINEYINPIMYTRQWWNSHTYTPFHHNVTEEGVTI